MSNFNDLNHEDLVARLEAVEALVNAAWLGNTYILPGGYPSRPVEAFNLRAALEGESK